MDFKTYSTSDLMTPILSRKHPEIRDAVNTEALRRRQVGLSLQAEVTPEAGTAAAAQPGYRSVPTITSMVL
jgi:hypothetical protein